MLEEDQSCEDLTLGDALKLLDSHSAAASTPTPSVDGSRLPLDCLQVLPAAFQPRTLRDEVVDARHVLELVNALGKRGERGLDPILVFWSGVAWFVVDGHHRLAAYRSSKEWDQPTVLVEVFRGDARAAIAEATERNMKTNLPLLKMDKSNAGWRLVCLTELKVKEVMATADLSRSQVIKMRARLREIEEQYPDRFTRDELAAYGWREVLRPTFGGQEQELEFDDDRAIQLAHDIHGRLRREFKDVLAKNPDAFAMAIRLLHNGLPAMLMESPEWEDDRNQRLEAWLEERDNGYDF